VPPVERSSIVGPPLAGGLAGARTSFRERRAGHPPGVALL